MQISNEKEWYEIKYLNLFITAIAFIGLSGYNAMNAAPVNCVSIINQECRVRQS